MNYRIRELAEQATEYATTRHPVSNIALVVNSDVFKEKFAELIVQECIQVIQNKSYDVNDKCWNSTWEAGLWTAEDAVRQHFGVEE